MVATDSSPALRELILTPARGEVVARGDPAALIAALHRRLMAGAARPAAVVPAGDAVAAYLALFDSLVMG